MVALLVIVVVERWGCRRGGGVLPVSGVGGGGGID